MNDRELELELSKMFSSSIDEEEDNFADLAEQVWRRNRRDITCEYFAIFCAALLGCSVPYFVIGVFGPLPAVIANLHIVPLPMSNQWTGVIAILVTLLASLRITMRASEQ